MHTTLIFYSGRAGTHFYPAKENKTAFERSTSLQKITLLLLHKFCDTITLNMFRGRKTSEFKLLIKELKITKSNISCLNKVN